MSNKAVATSLLSGIMEPLGRCLTPASAREILALRPDEPARRRMEELAGKSDEGSLTAEERAEHQLFVEVGDLVALLQAKARRFLADHPGA
jgi:hypothetical protein